MKYVLYGLLGVAVLAGLVYFLGDNGLIAGLLGIGGIGGTTALANLKAEAAKLDQQADDLKDDLKDIEEEKKNLKVDDKTPEEEKDYWKNQ
jgi:cell division protein FtsB